MIKATAFPTTGYVRIAGSLPSGTVHIERSVEGSAPYTLRGGDLTVTTGGILLEDSEAPVAVPLTYRAEMSPTNRLVLINHALTPNLEHGQQTWLPGTGRVFSIGQDATGGRRYAHLTANPANQNQNPVLDYKTIASLGMNGILPGRSYLVTGMVRTNSADVNRWLDVKTQTWRQIKNSGKTWRQLRTTQVMQDPAEAYVNLIGDVYFGASTYVSNVQARAIPINQVRSWVWFSFWFTTPDAVPANPRLRLYHGGSTREWRSDWDLKDIAVFDQDDVVAGKFSSYFDGDGAVPLYTERMYDANSGDSSTADPWQDLSQDAYVDWAGVPGNSISRAFGPSKVATWDTTVIGPPEQFPGEPVLISDPVDIRLGLWVGLVSNEDLVHPAVKTDSRILNRRAKVSQSQVRGLEETSINVLTFTERDRTMFTTLFASGRTVLIRNPEPRYPENNWYLSCGDITEQRTLPDQRKAQRMWTIPYIRTDRPSGLISVSSGATWRQWKDAGVTWRQLRARRANWISVIIEPPDKP